MNRKYGWLPSPNDLRDFRASSAASRIELPIGFTLVTKTIKDQGNVNSCVAHSLSSMLEYVDKNIYSTGWIYGYRPEGYYQGEGMYPREALSTLLKQGAVRQEDFPVNIEMQEAKNLVFKDLEKLSVEAEDTKINAYARLYTIQEIKSWLYTKHIPVPISIATERLELDENNIIQIPDRYPNFGHMMLVIGWDECGLIVQNSWGEDWGQNGTAILPYEYEIKEAWGVTYTEQQTEDIKKPAYYFIRKLFMKIIKFIKSLLKEK